MQSYLDIESVVCVGGSWITPHALMRTRDWGAITELASAAVTLAGDIDLAVKS
jgi:2-dehydro-3-deoxyphosphogluconate aldolase/(4S)-4-hydroxy-2-oxoglutarate aldolase